MSSIATQVARDRAMRRAPLWLALFIALLSSLLPGGLPRTTMLGSAFNPATTAVALQPSRAQPRILIEQIRRDDDPGGGAGSVLPLAMPGPRYLIVGSIPGSAHLPVSDVPALSAGIPSDANPRAPPLS